MRKIWQVIAVTVVGLSLGLASVGCGSSPTAGKDKMDSAHPGADRMGGDKMGGDKMAADKMGKDKMDKK